MRRAAIIVGLSSATIVLCALCGCSWRDILLPSTPTLSNAVAVDRALHLCSLTQGDQPFHLILNISPPDEAAPNSRLRSGMQARIEIYWLNSLTYRTVIHSSKFTQIRIVNGHVVEEHDTGDFYPRWIQNFMDAIFDPIPEAATLRKVPGTIPVGVQSHACISSPDRLNAVPDQLHSGEICFQDAEPKIASGVDFTRSVWFSDFTPFGSQEIPRTLVDDLPASVLVRGEVTILEPLRQSDYSLVKAREFTPPAQQIETTLVSTATAQSLLDVNRGQSPGQFSIPLAISYSAQNAIQQPASQDSTEEQTEAQRGTSGTIYIRTDRTGKVREAYPDSSDHYRLQDAIVARALTLKFKPLIINGAPHQMEAPLVLPQRSLP